jgi:hypothetical protein
MCNLYSITTNQAAIIALFRIVNRYVGNLAPMPGVFADYPARRSHLFRLSMQVPSHVALSHFQALSVAHRTLQA